MLPPRAYIFIGLNGLRILSLIALLLVFASNISTLVHDVQAVNRFEASKATMSNTTSILNTEYISGSTVPNQPLGVFWAVLNRLLINFQVIILVLSEFGWPSAFFNRFFPVLGKEFSLGPLGIIQCLLGAAVLSHHVDTFSLVAAFFLFAIGFFNMLSGLIFSGAKVKRSVTSWREHAKSAIPTRVAGVDVRPIASAASSMLFKREKAAGEANTGHGFGAEGEHVARLKGSFISKPLKTVVHQ
ncbi:hypothetical protein DFH07DRAFT_848815 [Mycena maculata]|uniref:DUF7598 domain-containing protein n=1 Tax=Mycena maculata TaxID=230809 RepID=A0AAD7HYN6_9AGAR|nr:hypothetical protein DFH07DRAFT_848815 [Mycena maculata]